MIFKNYYKLLDLPHNVKSTQNEIKIAYRAQAKKYHPDVNIQNKAAEERFKDISEAYRILSDPIQKKKYDRSWNNYVGKKLHREAMSQKEVRANDIVNMFFGKTVQNSSEENSKLTPLKGENIETTLEISIKEAFDGTSRRISLAALNEKNKYLTIDIPSGIKSGNKIRVKGKGKPGTNGGNNGDLILNIKIKDSESFKLIDDDICVKLFVAPWDAALGAKAVVDGIDGQVSILIPKGTQNGDRISIPNKGYYKENKEQRGNLIIKTEIVIPKKLTSEEKALFMELKKKSSFNTKNIVKVK